MSVALVESERVTRERRYFVSSLLPDAARILAAVRSHWAIEDIQHWVLDTVFTEDQSRGRQRHAVTNLATLRRLALNMLPQDELRDSTRGKRQRAGWDENYLARLLGLQMRSPWAGHAGH